MNYFEQKKKKKDADLKEKVSSIVDSVSRNTKSDIAPLPSGWKDDDSSVKWHENWLQKGALEDGYDFGDVTKTILGTFRDVEETAIEAVSVATENLIDTGAEIVGKVGGWFGNKDFEDRMYEWANGTDLFQSEKTAKTISNALNWTNPTGAISNLILGNGITKSTADEYSVLDEKADSLVQSAADMIGTQLLKAIPGAGSVVSPLAMFNNAYRAEMRNAYANGATVDEAQWSAVIAGAAELIFEQIGGFKVFKGAGLDDLAKKGIAKLASSKLMRTLMSYGFDIFSEGFEEVATEAATRTGQYWNYLDDNPDFVGSIENLTNEEALQSYIDAAIGGAVMGFAGGAPNVVTSVAAGKDTATNLTANEEAVVKKVYEAELAEAQKKGEKVNKNKLWESVIEQMDRGELDVNVINEVLGGDEYTAYQDLVSKDEARKKELAELYEGEELKAELKNLEESSATKEALSTLGKNVFNRVSSEKESRLLNTYAEGSRRFQKFDANIDEYDNENAKKTIQNIIDSEAGNNTRRMHELADLMAKISADKGIVFSITDAKKLADTHLGFDGKTINGFVTEDGITINLDSPKYLNRVVGHEITHVLEGTEFYDTFRKTIEEYARGKGEYKDRLKTAWDNYKNIDGYKGADGFDKVKKEVIADLVGDYVFSDAEFIKNLSVKDRNLFEKIYDEIKYFCKVATAGSKEARDLERVKKAFEDAYRAEGVKKTDAASGRQLSVSDGSNVERTIYIKDGHTESGETVSFIDLILDGKKKGETRTHKSLTRKWVGIAKDGLVYGRVRLGEPYLIGKNSPEYQYSFIEGTEYDLKDDEQKYYYPIEEIEDFRDNPKPIVSNGNYGTYQYSVPDADTLTEAGKGKDIEVVGGVAVASNVADVLKSPEYKKPKDYMVSYSVSSTPAWEKNYLEQHHSANDLKVVDAVRSFTEKMVQDDAVRGYVPMGEYRYTKMGPLRSNMEYIVSFDMDTSCPRTFQFLNFRDAIQRKAGRYLTYNESINLLELMRAYGQQIPCCYCYVENKRVLLSASYNNFFGFRNAVLNAETDAEAEKLMYGYDAKKGLPEASRKAFERWRSDRAYNPSLTDVWTATNTARNSVLNFLDAQKEAGIINEKTAVSKLNKMVTEEFGITDKGAIAEIESFVNDWSYDTLANIPHMYNIDNDIDVSSVDERVLALNHEALAYSKSASSAKSVENYVPYTDQLKNISKEDRDYIMGMGGIRKHSSNDFRMDYVQDYFLFYADLAAEGWTGHTYTKSADFTRIFACTNDRINMSIAFYEDSDGELRENLDEGASWKDVKELRKAYKNVGAMAMVTSDNQLSFALNADWIDMIIPFHASGLDKAVWYNLRMWNDYTSKQSERFFNAETMRQRLVEAGVEIPKNAKSSDIKTLFDETFQIKHIYGKKGEVLKPHFFPGDTYVNGQLVPGHHNDVDTYFKLCEEYGVHPRFYGIKVSDTNGNQVDVTEHPSYLKLIKETARTDSEQETIQFNFGNYDPLLKMTPFEYAMKRLQEEAKNGGFENTKADPYGVVDEFINEYLDKDRPLGYLTERAKETRDILLEMSKEAAKQQADIVGQETEALSLSESGATPVQQSSTEISAADVRLQTPETFAPSVETAEVVAEEEITPTEIISDTEEVLEIAPVKEAVRATTPNTKKAKGSASTNDGGIPKAQTAPIAPGLKERSWYKTSSESEAVDGAFTPDDIPDELRYYEVKSNKDTLERANNRLNSLGYDKAVSAFRGQFSARKVTLDDLALGQRLIQEAVKRGDIQTAVDLGIDTSIIGTELGQMVQSLSIIQKLTPEGQLRSLIRVVERGKARGDKAFEGVEVTEDVAKTITDAYNADGTYDQADLNARVEKAKKKVADQMKVTLSDKANAWRYLAMLGNPKTHIRNLVSNVANFGTRAVKNAIARSAEDIILRKSDTRTKTWKKASSEVKEFAKKTTREEKAKIQGGNKYSDSGDLKQRRRIFQNNVLHNVNEFNTNAMEWEDSLFSLPTYSNALAEYLTANGISTKEDLAKESNGKLIEKGKAYALSEAKKATFRQDSYLAKKISEIESENKVAGLVTASIMPFKTTPINIAKTGLAYSPLGFARGLYDMTQIKSGKVDINTAIDHLAEGLTGTSLALIGYALASMGVLNGAGGDDKEGKYDSLLGKQAYSITIGGSTYSLNWLTPVSMPLFVGANAYETFVEKEEWDFDMVTEALGQTLDPLSEMSFLSSLDDVLSSYDSGVAKIWGAGESLVQNYITQYLPTLGSQVAQVFDDTKRSTKASKNSGWTFGEETWNKIRYKIPGLRNTLEAQTDVWGNEVKQSENWIARAFEAHIAPYARKGSIATEIDNEIQALYSETGDTGLIPSVPNNYVSYDGEKYEMSASEHAAYKKTYGQNAADLMEDLFATSTYQTATDEEKADMVNKVYSYAKDLANKELLYGRGVKYVNATVTEETLEDYGIDFDTDKHDEELLARFGFVYNSEKDSIEYYKENAIKGAIENNMYPDEYIFYQKYPEKYNFLKDEGISYREWDEFDEDAKRAYTWLYENPKKKSLVKAVASDVVEYRTLTGGLSDITADKDASGKTISNSRKYKVIKHINGLDLDYGEKIILYKSEYNSDDTYNNDIVKYLNSRKDLSYKDIETILKELGFTVDSNGNIYWD